jgi:PIN domain nuclease of toxin-antitoxin system
MIYLDTHVAVWLYAGDLERFPAKARDLLETNDIMISPMAILELGYLYEIERLSVEAPVIVEYLESAVRLQVCTIPFHRIALEALGLKWTRDPFDRLIVAQAACAKSALLTKDAMLRQNYPQACWD